MTLKWKIFESLIRQFSRDRIHVSLQNLVKVKVSK